MALTLVGRAAPARADGFVSPFVGYNFGGDSGCPQITNCDDKRLNAGVAIGTLKSVFGFEEEFGYAKDFFGSAPNLESSVLTVMSNLMLVPNLGPVRPYALVGIGLVKTHVSLDAASLVTSENNNLGWDVGGGLIVFFGQHVGLRGDVRYVHSFQDLETLGFTLGHNKLDFGRFAGALVFAF
jgi:opacity protein-like surface antigen